MLSTQQRCLARTPAALQRVVVAVPVDSLRSLEEPATLQAPAATRRGRANPAPASVRPAVHGPAPPLPLPSVGVLPEPVAVSAVASVPDRVRTQVLVCTLAGQGSAMQDSETPPVGSDPAQARAQVHQVLAVPLVYRGRTVVLRVARRHTRRQAQHTALMAHTVQTAQQPEVAVSWLGSQ